MLKVKSFECIQITQKFTENVFYFRHKLYQFTTLKPGGTLPNCKNKPKIRPRQRETPKISSQLGKITIPSVPCGKKDVPYTSLLDRGTSLSGFPRPCNFNTPPEAENQPIQVKSWNGFRLSKTSTPILLFTSILRNFF